MQTESLGLGVLFFLFSVSLILVSISPLRKWRLDPDNPLDDDDLDWPAAGYGSAAVSLNGLFGAYWGALILVGYACFIGIIIGIITALVTINLWISRWIRDHTDREGFETLLFNTKLFKSKHLDILFWLLLSTCLLGLALSELILVQEVFIHGLGLHPSQATAASLAAVGIAYYYCLLGGYQALFRTDALQYFFILLMGVVILGSLWLYGPETVSQVSQDVPATPARLNPLPERPIVRISIELVSGFALGTMPVLAAPDAWKRILIIKRKRRKRREFLRSGTWSKLVSTITAPPVKLLVAGAVPLLLITPALMAIRNVATRPSWSFPIEELFATSPAFVDGLIALGMIGAFMSTFDGALLSAVHVLYGIGMGAGLSTTNARGRFRVLLAFSFTTILFAFLSLPLILPNPYALGAVLVTPFAIVAAVLLGSSFGVRRLQDSLAIIVSLVILLWVVLVLQLSTITDADRDPYSLVPLVLLGCASFFVLLPSTRLLSHRPTTSKD